MILYIAGPMSGRAGLNFKAFNRAERVLTAAGFEVLNPTRQQEGLTQEKYRELGVIDVLNSEGVAVLDGYEDSRGARLETYVANDTGRPVRTVDAWLEMALFEEPPA